MPLEIERKFLVRPGAWTPDDSGVPYMQGYLVTGPPASVRVRIAGDHAYLTIKHDRGAGIRAEYEYAIPVGDAREMLNALCGGRVVDKTRYEVVYEGNTWDVDVFHGANDGLVVAEIELDSPDEPFTCPPWIGDEVTGDPRYLNSYLSQHPKSTWSSEG